MIIQGSNQPITISFDEDMSLQSDIEIALFSGSTELKHWSKEDLTIDEDVIQAPLTQEETMDFPAGSAILEVKWYDTDSMTQHTDPFRVWISGRKDHTIMGGA